MKAVLILVGPTGIGKTYLSIKIAQYLNVEIVSADSRQIYRLLDIGTAKPSQEILESIPHHLINFLRPDEYFSAGMYSQIGRRVIDQIHNRGNIALVVGGSGLYIHALIDGLHNIDVRDEKIRSSLRSRMLKEGVGALYKELKLIDPKLAGKIKPKDTQRIIRGLEVYLKTGQKMSELQEEETKPADFIPMMYGLNASREYLYHRINDRVDQMLEKGFLAEAANLRLMGYKKDLNALNTVGYKEIFEYLDDHISFDEMIELTKRNSRRYAKRQLTWFRKDERIKWIDVSEDTDYSEAAEKITREYQEKYLN
jgi:tRNA dimethylallyltransferase